MIAYIDIEVNAANPQMPIGPCVAFVGSPSNVRILKVPKGIGSWKIDAVAVAFTRPDNSITTVSAVNVAGCWVATLPASDVSGRCDKGFQIEASGIDENGNAVTGYVLGVGDVVILPRDGTAVSDGVQYYFHYRDAVPTTPRKGDTCLIDGTLKWYDGTAWQVFAAGADIDVVPPSTDPADTGKAADAKATGDALALKADTSDLPYALNTITPTVETSVALPDSAFPIRFVDSEGIFGGTGTTVTLNRDDVTYGWDDLNWAVLYAGNALLMYTVDGAYDFNATGADYIFGYGTESQTATSPNLVISTTASAALANRAVNFVAGAFSALVLTLPEQQDGKSRDFYLQVVNPADLYPVTVNGARLIDASGASVTLTAPANQTTWRFTETWNAETSTSADPVFVVTGANETAAIAAKYVKPSGGIPKTDMTSAVQTSLGKADTAVQPAALAGAVRYDLPSDATVISSASSEVVEGETVTYGEATLADRTANCVAITAEIAELRLTFPAAVSGKVRDFGLRVEVGDGTDALTAPALVPVEPTGETIKLENPDAAIPALADGAADAKGVTLLYFSETSPGKFWVKGEEVKEVA